MAQPVTYNTILDPGQSFVFLMRFRDDGGGLIDVSAWTFQFILRSNVDNSVVWTINNGDFTRPTTSSIRFSKTAAQIAAIVSGNYTPSLLVTNPDVTADEWLTGTFQR